MSIELDSLRMVRSCYYLGLMDRAMQEAEDASATAADAETERMADVFYHRALLETSAAKVFQKVGKNANTALQAVKLQATYRAASADNKELVFGTLAEWLSDPDVSKDETLQVLAAQIYLQEQEYKQALKLVVNSQNLEKQAICVQIYLKIHRLDLAQKVVSSMQSLDDDDVLTQLCAAWVYTIEGGEKATEATFLLQELIERFGPSVRVFNMLAACQMSLRNYSQAFQHCKKARDTAIKAGGKPVAETLVNTIICLTNLRKDAAIIERITGELRKVAPAHPWLKEREEMGGLFDKYAAEMSG